MKKFNFFQKKKTSKTKEEKKRNYFYWSIFLFLSVIFFFPLLTETIKKEVNYSSNFSFFISKASKKLATISKEEKEQTFYEQYSSLHEAGHLLVNILEIKKLKQAKIATMRLEPDGIEIYNLVEKSKNNSSFKILTYQDGSNQRGGKVSQKDFDDKFWNYWKTLAKKKQIIFLKAWLKILLAGYLSEKILTKRFSYSHNDFFVINFHAGYALYKLYCPALELKKPTWCSKKDQPISIWNTPFLQAALKETEKTIRLNQKKILALGELLWNVKQLKKEEIKQITSLIEANKQLLWSPIYTDIIKINREKTWYLQRKNYFPQTERTWQILEKKLTSSQINKNWEKEEKLTDLLPIIREEINQQKKASSKTALKRTSYDNFIRKVVNQEKSALKAWKQLVNWKKEQKKSSSQIFLGGLIGAILILIVGGSSLFYLFNKKKIKPKEEKINKRK